MIGRRRALVGLAAPLTARQGWPLLAALSACTLDPDHDHAGPDAPRVAPLAVRPRVAWVLGSGGPRGFVHVGVLKALDELGLAPDLIVGASVGALVGTLRAGGLGAQAIEALALELNPLAMGRLAMGTDARFSGTPIAELVHEQLDDRPLERLPIAMACVALRASDQMAVAFTAGDAGLAVQASAALPGRLAPVRIRGERYLDPDAVAPVPVRLARALGARRVLAVDASAHPDRAPPGAERYRESDLRKQALVDADTRHADLVLKPDFGYWVSFSREFRERAIAAGQRETLARADALRDLHGAPDAPGVEARPARG